MASPSPPNATRIIEDTNSLSIESSRWGFDKNIEVKTEGEINDGKEHV